MPCLKCGRETSAGQVFCSDCLKEMEKYPVNPDTHITIIKRPEKSPTVQKKTRSMEELLELYQKRSRRLRTAVIVLSILLAIALGGLSVEIYRDFTMPHIGQNYSTETSPTVIP